MPQTSPTKVTNKRFTQLSDRYGSIRLAIVGDVCLDRYLQIDGRQTETSIETGLPVHNIIGVRPQPGASGTILANAVALGAGEIHLVGFRGDDGEGYELDRELRRHENLHLDGFLCTPDRHTFVYTKPMLKKPNQPLRELSRFDQKNWTKTPASLQQRLADQVQRVAPMVDAMILMDQVDLEGSGVICNPVLEAASAAYTSGNPPIIFADSRRGVGGFPPMGFKMNEAEFQRWTGDESQATVERVGQQVNQIKQPLVVTLADRGVIAAVPGKPAHHEPAQPSHGPIDIVGAGDSVLANLVMALAAGATIPEALRITMAAASVVIHQLGTTGTATMDQIAEQLSEN